MTETLIPHQGTSPARLTSALPVLSLHGSADGIPMTWHVTQLENGFLIERAEGDIHSPAVWMQARRDAFVGEESDVLDLVRAVMLS